MLVVSIIFAMVISFIIGLAVESSFRNSVDSVKLVNQILS